MPDIFVSYAGPDREAAFQIVAFLEGHGVACWVAPRDVGPGVEYGQAIIDGIEASRAIVLVLSEHANESPFVRKEVERAVSKVKPILPVRIREVQPAGALEFFISSSQWIDAFRPPLEQHLLALVQAVTGAPASGPVAASSPQPAARKRWPWIAAAAAVILLLLAGGVAWTTWKPSWARDPAGFLVGDWCATIESGVRLHWVFRRIDADRVQVEIDHSHTTDRGLATVRARATKDGLEVDWAEAGAEKPDLSRYRVVDGKTLYMVFAGDEATEGPVLVRCKGRQP